MKYHAHIPDELGLFSEPDDLKSEHARVRNILRHQSTSPFERDTERAVENF